MKGYFCNDVRNIIETLRHRYCLDCLNKKYRQVFWFFDILVNWDCPNPNGRCVTRYQNAKVHWLNGKLHRLNNPAI